MMVIMQGAVCISLLCCMLPTMLHSSAHAHTAVHAYRTKKTSYLRLCVNWALELNQSWWNPDAFSEIAAPAAGPASRYFAAHCLQPRCSKVAFSTFNRLNPRLTAKSARIPQMLGLVAWVLGLRKNRMDAWV